MRASTRDGSAYANAERAASRRLLRIALRHLPVYGAILAAAGASYSRTAGCSCGCSPGFIIPAGIPATTLYINAIEPAGCGLEGMAQA